MRKLLASLFMTILLGLSAPAVFAQGNGTIILIVDVSGSINEAELSMQRDGYISALTNIPYLRNVNIETIFFHKDAMMMSSGSVENAIKAFQDYDEKVYNRGITCMTRALQMAEMMIPNLPKPVIIDISGDGQANCADNDGSNDFKDLVPTLDRLAAQDVRINTLYIVDNPHAVAHKNDQGDPLLFYRALTRNGGFTINIDSMADIEAALYEKLIMEIAQLD